MGSKTRKLSSTITIKILIFSSVITFFLTFIQLIFDYKTRKDNTIYFVNKVIQTSSSTLAHNLWFVNIPSIKNQLQSTLNLNDIASIKMEDADGKILFDERKKKINTVLGTESLEIKYFDALNQEEHILGKIQVAVTSDNILKELLDKLIFVLINQFVKTIFVSGFILWIVRKNVTDRISKLLNSVLPFQNISNQGLEETQKNIDKLVEFKSEYNDELSQFRSFLISIIDKQCQYINQIRNMNLNLEEKIAERTREISHKNRSLDLIMSNIQQGIFMVDEHLVIKPEYSRFTEKILQNEELANKSLMEAMLSKTSLSLNDRKQVISALMCSFGEAFLFELNKHLLPNELTVSNGKNIMFCEISWIPIFHEGCIYQVMISLLDVTEIRQLRLESQRSETENKKILEIIELGQDKFALYFSSMEKYLIDSMSTAKKNENIYLNEESIKIIFRNLHTIKGSSRSMGFQALVDFTHDAEQAFYDYFNANNPKPKISRDEVIKDLFGLKGIMNSYVSLNSKKIAIQVNREQEIELNRLYKLLEQTTEDAIKNEKSADIALKKVYKILVSGGYKTLKDALVQIVKSLPDYAQELGKKSPEVSWGDTEIWIPSKKSNIIVNIFEHLIRNSLAHGLEPPAERRAKGISDIGKLIFSVKYRAESMVITYLDDGRGLNLDSLREKCPLNADMASDAELAELVFKPGLSTSANPSQISGRGVGLDAVRSLLDDEGGSIQIEFVSKLEGSYRKIQFKITLPYHIPKAMLTT